MASKPLLLKPKALKAGDTVATVSLSWGGAGDPEFLWRYEQGKARLEALGLNVIEMPHTLKGSDYLYQHPEARAADLMAAFQNPEIKGIFSCIGGDDSIRLLPYIDENVIRANPKVWIGYSDSTITHLKLYKAGLGSFYGASILMEFAENIEMHAYTRQWIERVLFEPDPIGEVPAPSHWTGEYLPWLIDNQAIQRQMSPRTSYEVLQGRGKVTGHLLGGCVEVLEMAKGTEIWPSLSDWTGALLFLETSEDTMTPASLRYTLRSYAAQGMLRVVSGLLFGKPYQDVHYDAYKAEILKVLKEEGLTDLPVFYNMAFGHTSPMCVMPYGCLAELDCDAGTFTLLESGVEAVE